MTQDNTYPMLGRHLGNQIAVSLVVLIPFLLTGGAIALAIVNQHLSWLTVAIWAGFQLIGGIGITLGYHRMTTHGAFKAKAPVRALLVWAGLQALQGGPASWAATHRRHHALADQPGDPHSPLDGLWHSHVGWMIKGNMVHSGPAHERLMRDPVIRFFEKTQLLWYILTFVLPGFIALAITGSWGMFWQAVLWAGVVRVFIMHHVTWSINSICHLWGARPYDSPDVARNNAIFGVLGYGEGWHNNHHAFPDSAYLGHRWYQFDLGKYVLWALRPFGLVHSLKIPTLEQRAAKQAVAKAKKLEARAAKKAKASAMASVSLVNE